MTLLRCEADEAMETLGIFLAPSGNLDGEFAKFQKSAQVWVDNMKSCNLTRAEVWVSLQPTIWRTLTYPLPSINLRIDQWERIMAIVLNYALPAMGICKHFPCSIVFAPDSFFGLGIQHLYTIQEIMGLKDIIFHTNIATMMGLLYQATLELLFLEVGIIKPLQHISYSISDVYALIC